MRNRCAISPEVFRRLDAGEHVARLHLLGEFFAIMTGRGVEVLDPRGLPERLVFSQGDCAAWLRKFVGKLQFEELTPAEVLDGLDHAEARGIQGAAIYDYWHVLAARKTHADEILTRNTSHFEAHNKAVPGQARVVWP